MTSSLDIVVLWDEAVHVSAAAGESCHLLEMNETKTGSFLSGLWPEGGDESEDSVSLLHSQVT